MLPLQGIKVVEIAQNLAGPYAAEILATLGADVIKIDTATLLGWTDTQWDSLRRPK